MLVDCAANSITHLTAGIANAALEKLSVFPIRVVFLPCLDDAGCEMFVTELTAQPTRAAKGRRPGHLRLMRMMNGVLR